MSILDDIQKVKKKMKEQNLELQQRLDDLEQKRQKMMQIVQTEPIVKCNCWEIFCDSCSRQGLRYIYSKDDLDVCLECAQEMKSWQVEKNVNDAKESVQHADNTSQSFRSKLKRLIKR